MLITTSGKFEGYEIINYLGISRGIIVRSTGFVKGFLGGIRSIGGGNVPEYVDVCEKARQQAYELMIQDATELGANAIIAMRYDATEFLPGTTEVLAYGTAVICKKV